MPNPWYNKLVDMVDSYPKFLQNLWIGQPVHSSQLKSTQKPDEPYFYTIGGTERDKPINEYPHVWTFEDVAYYAFHEAGENLPAVYRLWSPKMQTHFWTINDDELRRTSRDFADTWIFEGVAFYAYPQGRQPLGTMPVYRFWSSRLGSHFYTIDETEKNKLVAGHPHVWDFEGVAWYAYAKPY